VDLGRGVQVEPYDWSQGNNTIAGANALAFGAGEAGHQIASVAGSLYSQEGLTTTPWAGWILGTG